MSGEKTDRDM